MLKKPTNLDLHCLLRQGMLCSAREGLVCWVVLEFNGPVNTIKDMSGGKDMSSPPSVFFIEW